MFKSKDYNKENMEFDDVTIDPCIEGLLEGTGKPRRKKFSRKALEREAKDIYDENVKPVYGHDSYLEQIQIDVPASQKPSKPYKASKKEITDMIIDLS